MNDDKERIRRDISEAFDFVRFLLKRPRLLKKIPDGSEIRFLPAMPGRVLRPAHLPGKVQAFTTETVFHAV